MSSSRMQPNQDPRAEQDRVEPNRVEQDRVEDRRRGDDDPDLSAPLAVDERDRAEQDRPAAAHRDFDDRADEVEDRIHRLEDTGDDPLRRTGRDEVRDERATRDGERTSVEPTERDDDMSEARDPDLREPRAEQRGADEDRRDDHRRDDGRDDDRRDDVRRVEVAGAEGDRTRRERTDGDRSDADSAADSGDDRDDQSREEDAERDRMREEFAKEHDPADHDVEAGAEFRQRGDLIAEDGQAKALDRDGHYQEAGDEQALADGTAAPVQSDQSDQSEHSGQSEQSGQDASGVGGDSSTNNSSDSNDSNDSAGSDDGQSRSETRQTGTNGDDTSSSGRRVSDYDEVKDGGYGVGSARPIDDGAQPLGHPVKAWKDTMTYVEDAHAHYGSGNPHVWFTDAEAAQRVGFRRADD